MLAVVFVFLLGAGAVLGGYAALTYVPKMLEERNLQRRLFDLSSSEEAPAEEDSVLARIKEGPLPSLDRLVSRSQTGSRLTRLIEQSGIRTTASAIGLIMLLLAVTAAGIAYFFTGLVYLAAVVAVIVAALPIAFLLNRRSARLHQFEEHFPEALDLLSRALRAGHAFQSAMGMVAEEMKQPIGPEFKRAFDQQNYGLPLREALMQMTDRVPLLDVRFFVTAVLIQRDTGGNLSEILDNLSSVVRERFKVLRQVRVHTAHGRFTGFVLLALPAALGIMLSMINPDHMRPLFQERIGQTMLIGAIVMQTVGFIWIRQVIKIEV